ncbi:MAG TPA: NAD(P)/FAD-dependent oxidoreductase [Phototrophicaceae bacterium]|nr:NAD(P)/FAD-dependent oxidoreductase [Phototrophicaceae bacterium]
MKVAIIGIGVAGAYLMNQLSSFRDVKVTGFERMEEKNHDAVCAWATCDNVMSKYAKKCGLDFENYVLHDGKRMTVDVGKGNDASDCGGGGGGGNNCMNINLKGMVSYDKLKLIQDMIKGTDIVFNKVPEKNQLEQDFDVIVDSTGFHRHYLPKLKDELWIPCIQYKVKYDKNIPFDDFYLKAFPSLSGYFWYFPLGNGYAHIGSGDFRRKHTNEFLEFFLKKYDCTIIKKVGRPVRITPPSKCIPFSDGKKTVGVGESIGTVYPLLGEGIIPSTICADIFINNLDNLDRYYKEILSKFKIYTIVYNFIKMKISNNFSVFKNFFDLIKIYGHMKMQENRYGMEIDILNMLKLTKI